MSKMFSKFYKRDSFIEINSFPFSSWLWLHFIKVFTGEVTLKIINRPCWDKLFSSSRHISHLSSSCSSTSIAMKGKKSFRFNKVVLLIYLGSFLYNIYLSKIAAPTCHQTGWHSAPTCYQRGWHSAPTCHKTSWYSAPTYHKTGWYSAPPAIRQVDIRVAIVILRPEAILWKQLSKMEQFGPLFKKCCHSSKDDIIKKICIQSNFF